MRKRRREREGNGRKETGRQKQIKKKKGGDHLEDTFLSN